MIFLTSNLGSHEVMNLMNGGLGFAASRSDEDEELDQKIYRAATEAARRKFSPEFMNRIDKVIVFRALTRENLEKILDIELARVQQRIINATDGRQFVFRCTAAGAGLPAARRHRHQVRGPPPEAVHRAPPGVSHVEFAGHRADSAGRPHHRGF